MLSPPLTLASATILLSSTDAAILPHTSYHLSSRALLVPRAIAGYADEGCYTETAGQRTLARKA